VRAHIHMCLMLMTNTPTHPHIHPHIHQVLAPAKRRMALFKGAAQVVGKLQVIGNSPRLASRLEVQGAGCSRVQGVGCSMQGYRLPISGGGEGVKLSVVGVSMSAAFPLHFRCCVRC